MKKYIVYYTKVNNNYVECIGLESIICPDQRYSTNTIINKVLNKEFIVHNNANAFRICTGSRCYNVKPITNYIEL